MLLVALALAAAGVGPADPAPLQILASPAFDRFAAAVYAACPQRRLHFVIPGDLDVIEEDFVAAQSRRGRQQIAAANDGGARCAGRKGLSCPTTAMLDAFVATGAIERFAAYACRAKPPR